MIGTGRIAIAAAFVTAGLAFAETQGARAGADGAMPASAPVAAPVSAPVPAAAAGNRPRRREAGLSAREGRLFRPWRSRARALPDCGALKGSRRNTGAIGPKRDLAIAARRTGRLAVPAFAREIVEAPEMWVIGFSENGRLFSAFVPLP